MPSDGAEIDSFEQMTADDWEAFLKQNTDSRLVVTARDGTHAFEYDSDDEQVTFYAHGSAGYDYDGTRAALEEVAGQADGLEVRAKPMADGGTTGAEQNVANARSMLREFEDESVEVQYGSIKHAIEELENARRKLPDEY